MGLFDTILGRTKPAKANLDNLFAMPAASITLNVNANLQSKGVAAVCYKPSSGAAFENTVEEFTSILDATEAPESSYTITTDTFGYTWVVVVDPELESLTTSIHVINRSLEDHGFAQALLCSAFRFDDRTTSTPVYWIYLYKKGTFYPFVPTGPDKRDNERELALKALAKDDLHIEPDLANWMPTWGLPL